MTISTPTSAKKAANAGGQPTNMADGLAMPDDEGADIEFEVPRSQELARFADFSGDLTSPREAGTPEPHGPSVEEGEKGTR